MTSWRWLVVSVLCAAMFGACSKPEEEPKGGEGDACTVDADCEADLACRDAVCVLKAGGGPDAGPADGGDGTDGGADGGAPDNNDPVADEDFMISYILEGQQGVRALWLFDSASGEHTQVSPEGLDCRLGCWLSEDLSTFAHAQANGPTFDLLTAPTNADYTVTETPVVGVTGVRRLEVVGDLVTYVKEDAGENKAYYTSLDGGTGETFIGVIGDVVATEGDWAVDARSGQAVVYNATLQTMSVRIGDLGAEIGDAVYTIDSSNYQETSGSYFGGNIPTAFSPDGKYMALVTQKAPMDYQLCESSSECTGPGQRCGRSGRCKGPSPGSSRTSLRLTATAARRCGRPWCHAQPAGRCAGRVARWHRSRVRWRSRRRRSLAA